ncbi:hypothetical protein NQ318_019303 [Aromia moschata]|uniref:Uncharacterized protein n=1 Tax=Aromia moschata TaxID=1265417 RepID=A0AAV8X7I7_9CUCU|nr:hypothetical protein NQ318_019303 [Aromia moschata]
MPVLCPNLFPNPLNPNLTDERLWFQQDGAAPTTLCCYCSSVSGHNFSRQIIPGQKKDPEQLKSLIQSLKVYPAIKGHIAFDLEYDGEGMTSKEKCIVLTPEIERAENCTFRNLHLHFTAMLIAKTVVVRCRKKILTGLENYTRKNPEKQPLQHEHSVPARTGAALRSTGACPLPFHSSAAQPPLRDRARHHHILAFNSRCLAGARPGRIAPELDRPALERLD